jgi:dual specificity tyrosine-phosphorylation-regulated kinase 2/3/4
VSLALGSNSGNQSSPHFTQCNELTKEQESTVTRSISATSTLDPYYFGVRSPSDSPIPPLPDPQLRSPSLDTRVLMQPMTPVRDPATIDRRGLVGVGELATPRWAKVERYSEEDVVPKRKQSDDVFSDGFEVIVPETENEGPDSPWTIEAVDGELDEQDEASAQSSLCSQLSNFSFILQSPTDVKSMRHAVRPRRSLAEESGGEEILYPRQLKLREPAFPLAELVLPPLSSPKSTSPRLLATPLRKPKKRTSEEHEMEHISHTASPRTAASKDKAKDDKASSRKHRSLGLSIPSSPSSRDKGKERNRDSLISTAPGGLKPSTTSRSERHSRQASASSSSSNLGDGPHPRRVNTTDFSHLPPSPSSSSIQQFLRHANSIQTPPLHSVSRDPNPQASPNVAHSLLRGTQEGWSGLDDEATAEALRKLDGLSGKSARARASISSLNRAGSLSRPGTPSGKPGTQWEGMDGAKVLRRNSARSRESMDVKDKEPGNRPLMGLGIAASDLGLQSGDLGGSAKGNDDTQSIQPASDKTPRKSGSASARSSFTPKRGSASSTTYTSTPTTTSSSRDSATLSMTTNATSVSASSGRHSTGKLKRNSTSSDISSIHSSDAASLKDRVAALAISGDGLEDDRVPPVPPLPKGLTNYRSPPQSTTAFAFPSVPLPTEARRSHDSEKDRTIALEVPPFSTSSPTSASSSGPDQQHSHHFFQRPNPIPVAVKTPSKKWSFSNALNLIAHSPSSASSSGPKAPVPLSPRSLAFGQQLRKSESKDHGLISTASAPPRSPWSTRNPEAMASAGSLVSLSSVGSQNNKKSATAHAITTSRTPDRHMSNRSETSSSGGTNHATSASANLQTPLSPTSSLRRGPSTKRLTPSSIPFFRRSSSQSMQFPPTTVAAVPVSPTPSSGQPSSTPGRSKASTSSPKRLSLSSPACTTAQKKSSVLSLGLPSLLKGSSSRRSLHADELKDPKEAQRVKDNLKSKADREKERMDREREKAEREKQKKEEKERSESRISVLMGRKRGKVSFVSTPTPQFTSNTR